MPALSVGVASGSGRVAARGGLAAVRNSCSQHALERVATRLHSTLEIGKQMQSERGFDDVGSPCPEMCRWMCPLRDGIKRRWNFGCVCHRQRAFNNDRRLQQPSHDPGRKSRRLPPRPGTSPHSPRLRRGRQRLENFFSGWKLVCSWERLHQIALAADSHCRETFEPFLIRYLGFGVEPLGKQSQVICRNLARTDSVEEMM